LKAITYREEYLEIGFTPPLLLERWTRRVRLFMELFREIGLDKVYSVIKPGPCPEDALLLAHEKDYVEFVREKGEEGVGYLDYGDTPAYPNVYHKARLAVGGTFELAKMVAKGELEVGFNPQGGFHHAKKDAAAGFCVFNDIAIAAYYLLKQGFKKIAIVDIDGHHGDGTQEILYREPVLKISIHRYSPGVFFPGTGGVEELGEGEGYGYSVNVPLPEGSGDDVFEMAMKEVIIPLLEKFKPEVLIAQMGVDAHEGDPLVGLRFTSRSYSLFAEEMRRISLEYRTRIIGLGGGGYEENSTSRMWALMLSKLVDMDVAEKLRDEKEGISSNSRIVEIVRKRIKHLKSELEIS